MSYKNSLFHILLFLLGLGLVYSTVLQTISISLITIVSILDFGKKASGHLYVKSDLGWLKNIGRSSLHNGFVGFLFLFLYVLIGGYECSDWVYFIERLKIKMPFLILPFAFLGFDKISASKLLRVLLLLLSFILVSSIDVLLSYIDNPGLYEATLKRGGALDTPGNHIRFSSLLAFTMLTIFYLKLKVKQSILTKWLSSILLVIGVLFLHYLSVRSGLLIFYIGLIVLLLNYLVYTKANKLVLMGLLAIVVFPVVFYNVSAGFKNKMDYMVHDINQFKSGKGALYADSGRLVSLDVGYEIWKESPLVGHGACNIRPLVHNRILNEYPGYPINLMPHNQFLFVLIGNGLFGLILFFLGYLLPFYKSNFKNPLVIMMFLCFTASMLIDHLFEGTVGVCMFLFFTLISFRLRLD